MTDTPTADGLEKRLRDRVGIFREYLSEVGTPSELPYTTEDAERDNQAADALAKARVALQEVQQGLGGRTYCAYCGAEDAKNKGHDDDCHIGAALEALK